ncbi:putative glycoside hydrolase [Sulfurimonas sp.]|uniref:putative glycoside hydrolase n=1 Tax=Sulfurimonas sp. TaxID=2022749 RepID=UPI0025E17E89|nr:putative glycoside hydrolase [Sulfurimonas sp.]MDD5157275.1 putative glycoside hydrolase [Sulfurimonas sp.]
MKIFLFLVLFVNFLFGAMTTGIVFDKKSNKPIENAIIVSDSKEYKTDSNGSFAIPYSKYIGVRAVGYDRKFYITGGKMYLDALVPKAIYLSSLGATNGKIMSNAKEIARETEVNAFVIDIKMDRGQVAYRTDNQIANKIGAQNIVVFKDLKLFIANLKKEKIYTIARIVCFKDTPFVTAFSRLGIKREDGTLYKDKEGLSWMDASQREGWEYIVSIAKETAAAGFDEIQFDYVRFPDAKGLKLGVENSQAERVKAISGFLEYARMALTPYNVFMSADVFGYVSWHDADLDIGQRVDSIMPYVDYISPMLYPSGFNHGIPGFRNPVAANYEIVKLSLDRALKRSYKSPLSFRPWLQAFRDYAYDRRIYGEKEIRDQIRASDDFGSCGWILWNPRNAYSYAGLNKLKIKAIEKSLTACVEPKMDQLPTLKQ